MTDVLGLPLAIAVQRLSARGETVRTVEVSSRKGSRGDDARVIKTERTDTETIVYWARFQTEAER